MRARCLPVVAVIAALSCGCAMARRALGSASQVESILQLGHIVGRIDTQAPAEGPLVVVLARAVPDRPLIGVDTFVRTGGGPFAFAVTPGRYHLGAYEDRNGNDRLDPGERTHLSLRGPLLEVGAGEVIRRNVILVRDATTPSWLTRPLDVFELVARTPRKELGFSIWALSAQGVIADPKDARFGREAGQRGLWQVMDFLNEGLAGVYFVEQFEPNRVPVLFVHGLGGTPRDFVSMVSALDRERFQPWLYFYPSGHSLDRVADHLAVLLARLQVTYGFEELAIVAHSMGGLVSRGAILKYATAMGQDDVRLLVTLATPWSGAVRAEYAALAPIVLPLAFEDLGPSSDYLHWLFYDDAGRARALPEEATFHLLLGFQMRNLSTTANDGVVTVASQARLEAQQQAASVRAFDAGHVDILTSPAAIARVNELLRDRFPGR